MLIYQTLFLASPDRTDIRELGSYMYSPILSPDGEYLAYRTPYEENIISYADKENLNQGVFIKNVETGELTFYEMGNGFYPRTICWGRKTSIDRMIPLD